MPMGTPGKGSLCLTYTLDHFPMPMNFTSALGLAANALLGNLEGYVQ